MATKRYSARLDSHPGQPGFLVEFRHPGVLDRSGKEGRKLRRGLGTGDAEVAQRVVDDLNAILGTPELHSLSARKIAKAKFHPKAVEVFFDAFMHRDDLGEKRRNKAISLPSSESEYNVVTVVGPTSVGKTTLLRLLSGSDHTKERFPATSGSRTSTFPLEIIVQEGPFRAAVSFLRETEVYTALEQAVLRAVGKAIEGREDIAVLRELLEPVEDGLRLKYLLGAEKDALSQVVATFPARIRAIASAVKEQVEKELDLGPIEAMRKEDQSAALELMETATEESAQTDVLVGELIEELRERSKVDCLGSLSHTATNWPKSWALEISATERARFITEVKRFSGNAREQFGNLLTPLVSGLRVSGPFFPKLFEARHPVVFCDTVGFGHYAASAGETPEDLLEQFELSDTILIVESAKGGFANAALHRLLESIATSGQTRKLLVAMTHMDALAGDDVDSVEEQREKALAGLRSALGESIRKSVGAEAARQLSEQVESNLFFLGSLNTDDPGEATVAELQRLYTRLGECKQGALEGHALPEYEWNLLPLAIRDAIEAFREHWQSLLGARIKAEPSPLSWQAQKAISRRYAEGWSDHYPHRPASSLRAFLSTEIARFLDNPISWSGTPTEVEKIACIDAIKAELAQPLRKLCARTLRTLPKSDWIEAYGYRGRYSTNTRSEKMETILNQQVPFLRSSAAPPSRELLRNITEEVEQAMERVKQKFERTSQPGRVFG